MERLIFKGGPGDLRHVPGRSIVVRVIEAAGIGEKGPRTPQLCCPLVHQVCKSLDTSSHMLCQPIGYLIGRFQQKTV